MAAPKKTPVTVDPATMPLLTPMDVAAVIRIPEVFLNSVRAGWLRPCAAQGKVVYYRRGDVDRVIARIAAGELPPVRERKGKKA